MTIPTISKSEKEKLEDAPFYLVFDCLDNGNPSEASAQELDEISQIRQMILESTDESPAFLTCT